MSDHGIILYLILFHFYYLLLKLFGKIDYSWGYILMTIWVPLIICWALLVKSPVNSFGIL